jgi:hypothetical protein
MKLLKMSKIRSEMIPFIFQLILRKNRGVKRLTLFHMSHKGKHKNCCKSDSKLKSGSCQNRSMMWKIVVRFFDQIWHFHSGKIVIRSGKS